MKGHPLGTLNIFKKSLTKPKKVRGKSHSAKKWKEWFLEALDAFKMKYQVLMVKVHNARKVVCKG